jgi:hypothetical protein
MATTSVLLKTSPQPVRPVYTVTGDVSWVFQYYLETRQQAWHGHPNHLTNKKYVSLANQGLK